MKNEILIVFSNLSGIKTVLESEDRLFKIFNNKEIINKNRPFFSFDTISSRFCSFSDPSKLLGIKIILLHDEIKQEEFDAFLKKLPTESQAICLVHQLPEFSPDLYNKDDYSNIKDVQIGEHEAKPAKGKESISILYRNIWNIAQPDDKLFISPEFPSIERMIDSFFFEAIVATKHEMLSNILDPPQLIEHEDEVRKLLEQYQLGFSIEDLKKLSYDDDEYQQFLTELKACIHNEIIRDNS